MKQIKQITLDFEIMKKTYSIIMLFMALLAMACYDDKGNYDYTELGEVEITFPQTQYQGYFGEVLEIEPTITTDIPEDDLEYFWEVERNGVVDGVQYYFTEFVPIDTGKVMQFNCHEIEFTIPGEGAYSLRLNVTQLSTGCHYYSDIVTMDIRYGTVYRGAMVLHGDGTSSDVGFIGKPEFQVTAETTFEEALIPNFYSQQNNGEKIPGKGEWLMQNYSAMINAYVPMMPTILKTVIATDQGAVLVDRNLVKEGEWNDLFYGNLNEGDPEGLFWNGEQFVAFDGGTAFFKRYNTDYFTTPWPMIDYNTEEEMDWSLSPMMIYSDFEMATLGFDTKSRAFIDMDPGWGLGNDGEGLVIHAEKDGRDLSDMQADLLYLSCGGEVGHAVAVMKGDDDNNFIVELNLDTEDHAEVYYANYDLANIPVDQVVDWAFGTSRPAACYYATSSQIFHFELREGQSINPQPLSLSLDGEITLMKLMKPEGFDSYYLANKLLVIGTYAGTPGSGKLYSVEIDENSGNVIPNTLKTYEGFGQIYDVNLKGI